MYSLSPNSTTNVYDAPIWVMQTWNFVEQRWIQTGDVSISFDYQLGRMLEWMRYVEKKSHMFELEPKYRLACSDGTIIPGDLFHE